MAPHYYGHHAFALLLRSLVYEWTTPGERGCRSARAKDNVPFLCSLSPLRTRVWRKAGALAGGSGTVFWAYCRSYAGAPTLFTAIFALSPSLSNCGLEGWGQKSWVTHCRNSAQSVRLLVTHDICPRPSLVGEEMERIESRLCPTFYAKGQGLSPCASQW